jgi:penicillin-binding protein 2
MITPLFEEIEKATRKYKRSKFSKESISIFKVTDVSSFTPKNARLNISQGSQAWSGVLLIGIVLFVSLTFLARAYKLQLVEGEDNLVLAEGNRVRVISSQAERGLILDRDGEILVRNQPAFDLAINTEVCLVRDNCLGELDLFLNEIDIEIDRERIERDIEKGKPNIVVVPNLGKEDLITIESQLGEFPNIYIAVSPKRDYIYGNVFAHLIGYVGFGDTLYPTVEGKTGVEENRDGSIKGVSGGEIIQVDSAGQRINVLSEKKTVPGKDVQLYADKELQILAYDLLQQKVESGEAVAGAVVAQDPQTGGILALVSYPAFDPEQLSSGITASQFKELTEDPGFPFFNRAISAAYPPASTFKMVMASAILMENIVGEHYQIMDNGFIQVGSYIFRNWNTSGHGLVDLRRALQVSNDTYFYTVGGGYGGVKGLGIEKIAKWAKKFGFGLKSGIDLVGETAGFMPDGTHRDWYLGDTYIASIGQSDILATPLQVNNVTSYFANGGFLYKPKVVKSVDGVESDTEVISQNLVDSHTYDVVREGLNLSVEPGGTGYPVFDFPQRHDGMELAGKTGTAEFGAVDNEDTHAWFTIFGPYGEEPAEISITVFLEEGGSGSSDAAPIAKELLDYWFSK